MSRRVKKYREPLPDGKPCSVVERLRQERELKEKLSVIVEYLSLEDVPLEERRKAAEKPLYLARYNE